MQSMVSYIRCYVFLFFVLLAGGVNAENTKENSVLSIPEDFNVLSVDGKKQPVKFFAPGGATLNLSKGEHRIVMVYDQFFERGDDTDRIKSEPFALHFTLTQVAHYQLQFTPPQNLADAKDFAEKPQVQLLIVGTKTVLANEIVMDVEKTDLVAHVVQTSVEAAAVKEAGKNVSATENVEQKDPNVLKQLQFWWQQANASQREEFLQSVTAKP